MTPSQSAPVTLVALALALSAPRADAAEPEACNTCHAQVDKAPGHRILTAHPAVTCTGCHRGDAKATTAEKAHLPPGPGELLRKTAVQAGCARCHIPGAVAGLDTLVEGTRVYLELGCPICHQGRNGFSAPGAFAPPLIGIAARGSDHLRQALRNPASLMPKTVMPPFALPAPREQALLVYLLAQTGEPTPALKNPAGRACVSCHTDARPPAKPPGQAAGHRCRWVHDARAEVGCARCHRGGVPTSTRECLYIDQRRRDCGVCHDGGLDVRP